MFPVRAWVMRLFSYSLSITTTRGEKTHLPVVLIIVHLFLTGWIKDFPPHNETYVERKNIVLFLNVFKQILRAGFRTSLVIPDGRISTNIKKICFRPAQSAFVSRGVILLKNGCCFLCSRDLVVTQRLLPDIRCVATVIRLPLLLMELIGVLVSSNNMLILTSPPLYDYGCGAIEMLRFGITKPANKRKQNRKKTTASSRRSVSRGAAQEKSAERKKERGA